MCINIYIYIISCLWHDIQCILQLAARQSRYIVDWLQECVCVWKLVSLRCESPGSLPQHLVLWQFVHPIDPQAKTAKTSKTPFQSFSTALFNFHQQRSEDSGVDIGDTRFNLKGLPTAFPQHLSNWKTWCSGQKWTKRYKKSSKRFKKSSPVSCLSCLRSVGSSPGKAVFEKASACHTLRQVVTRQSFGSLVLWIQGKIECYDGEAPP